MILAIALAIGCSSAEGEASPDGTPGPPEVVPPAATSGTGASAVADVTATLGEIGSVIVVRWTQGAQADVHLEYAFDEGVWLRSPTRSLGAGTWEDLLLGVPFDEEVTWRLVVDDGVTPFTSPDATIATEPLPAAHLAGQVTLSDPARYDAVGAPWLLVGLSEP
ncbi:MAG: hypothetical protein H0V89_10460, partial [Deltaproteobacteria bacterium]|nr:hypothetical protein [Deltaproteobacteria bacterium]